MRILLLALAALALAPALERRVAVAEDTDHAALAKAAVGEEPAAAERAIVALRAAGSRGLDALLELWGPAPGKSQFVIAVGPTGTKAGLDGVSGPRARLSTALDRVAAQKDARHARLFWHTDEAEALRRAALEGKPVLSLRMLGRLDEDMSCANSRFFRTALYPDPEVGRMLRERFVLHWKSVRPVPRLTIDFGDGRVLERPITGNSVHLVLDSRGRPVDAIPGLVGAGTFVRLPGSAEELAATTVKLDGAELTTALYRHHHGRIAALDKAWAADLTAVKHAAARPETLDDAELWAALGALHAEEARLSAAGHSLLAEKHHAGFVNRLTIGKGLVEAPLMKAILTFERSLAAEGVRNEQRMHRAIHAHFAEQDSPLDAPTLSDWIYREVFLTPPEDPWLGLLPDGEYAALDGGGVREPAVLPPK